MTEPWKILDADTHQMEPPSMWEQYIEDRYKRAAPCLQKIGARQAMAVEGESLTAEGKYPFSTPDFLAALMRGMQRFERTRSDGFRYFRRNVFVACRGDEMTLPSVVQLAGDANIVFNTDYPHPDGTWPWGMERLRQQPISEESKRRIFWDNAARAFRLER